MNNTNCLYDFIGIRGCGEDTPESGLYINSLPGLPLESIDKMASADQITYKNVYRDIQERALPKFMNAVNSLLKKRFLLKSVQTTIDLGRIKNLASTTAPAAERRGFVIDLNYLYPNYVVASNYQVIAIQSLSIYLNEVIADTGDIAITITDIDTGEVLKTLSIAEASKQVGWNVVNVNQYFKANRIFIAYDAQAITSVEMKIPQYAYNNFCGCIAAIYQNGCEAKLYGAKLSGSDPADLTNEGNNTFGLSAVFSIQCNYDFLVCNNKQLFATPLQYFLGAELMVERQFSSRINKWTLIDIDKAKDFETRFLQEAESQLELIVDGLSLDLNDCCFVCNSQVTVQPSRP